MNQEQVNRKLSCILSTDVVGYSRLMEENETSTVQYLEENKRQISRLIGEHNGRVVDSPGDNLLAEFSSAVKAVDCAVKIQKELKIKNADLVEAKRMLFRIGINLGDVIEEDGRLYGSGVNIAARIEGLANSGGICISRNVYDQVKNKLDLGYEYLGEHEVKNITEPVRVYRVQTGIVTGGNSDVRKVHGRLFGKMTIVAALIIIVGLLVWKFYPNGRIDVEPLSVGTELAIDPEVQETSKSIAVLPFELISSEKDQEYFADGLSEEILNKIAQIPDLKVTARTSSFSSKLKDKTIQEIADILTVDHILEGTVRKVGNSIRITAQLIKSADSSHLWSKEYDKEFNSREILTIQEDIARAVANELKLTLGVSSLKQLGGTDNDEAYEMYLVALGYQSNNEFGRALESINKAIMLDPGFALALIHKSLFHLQLALSSPPDQASLEFDASLNAAQMAISLEPDFYRAYEQLGAVQTSRRKFIEAELAYRKGMRLTVGLVPSYGVHCAMVGYLRKFHELLEEIRRKNPLDQTARGTYLVSLVLLGDMERAEKEYENGKAIFGRLWGDRFIILLRLDSEKSLSKNDLPEEWIEAMRTDRIVPVVLEHLESPEEGIAELRRIYNSDDNLSSRVLSYIAISAAYFGDTELSLNALEKSVNLQALQLMFYWAPVFHEVRQLPRFKEFVREIGLVDYWKEYGWPDLCEQVGDDDFVCN